MKRFRSLTGRMVTIATILVAIALLITNAVAAAAVGRTLLDRAEGELSLIPAGIAASPIAPPLQDLPVAESPFLNNLVVNRLDGSTGQVVNTLVGPALAEAPGPDLTQVQEATRAQSLPNEGEVTRVSDEQGGGPGYLVRAIPAPAQVDGAANDTIVIARSLNDVGDAVSRITVIAGTASIILLLLMVVLGIALMRRGLRPLRDVEEAAATIASGNSAARAPHADEPTEVGSLARTFNTMVDHLSESLTAQQDSEQRLRTFLADASHELRTPLTSIRAYAELMRQGVIGAAPDTVTAAARIETEAQRMGLLVDQLTTLARLDEAPELDLVRIDAADLLTDVAENTAAQPHAHVVDWAQPAEPLPVLADADILRRALLNLARNALTHTPEGTSVRLWGERDHDTVRLHVADNGPGMSPEVADRAFERFYRPEGGRTRGAAGSGLGLAIVHESVRALGGTVNMVTAPNRGTHVVIALPAAP